MTGPGILIWCQVDALIDGLLAQLMVVHSLLCPVLEAQALSLSMFIILSQPPMLVPLLLVPFILLVFIVLNLAILSGNAMTITDPALLLLHGSTHLQLLLLIHHQFITGHPLLASPPLPQVISIRGTQQSPGSNSSCYPYEHLRGCSTGQWPCRTHPRKRE